MSLFHYVKEAVSTRQAAEYYGVKVDQHGMACCPFHHDRHPSMKVDDRYYCFACHETGDVIDFVGRLFNLAPYDAAVKIAADFGLHPTTPQAAVLPVPARCNTEYDERQREGRCAAVLIDYECMLKDWRNIYAPDREDALHRMGEPKKWESHAYSEVMRNYAPEWKHFDNPRSFGSRFGRQKGWERPSDAAEPEAGTNSAKPPSGNQVIGNQLSYLPIPNEQAVAEGMPEEWIA